MWDEGAHIYGIPGVYNNFPSRRIEIGKEMEKWGMEKILVFSFGVWLGVEKWRNEKLFCL